MVSENMGTLSFGESAEDKVHHGLVDRIWGHSVQLKAAFDAVITDMAFGLLS